MRYCLNGSSTTTDTIPKSAGQSSPTLSQNESGSDQKSKPIPGYWGGEEYIKNGSTHPFILDSPMENCSSLSLNLRITGYSGYPFGNYYLYVKDLDGNWEHIDLFRIEKEQGDGRVKTYDFQFSQPQSFQALAICIADKGNVFSMSWSATFYY